MGELINKVKVKCDYDNSIDKHFIFTIMAKDKKDMEATVYEALAQKVEEGEMSTQNLRDIIINSDDERGFFSTIKGNVGDFLKRF